MANSPIDDGFATIVKSRLVREFGSVGALDADSIAYDGTKSIKEALNDKANSSDVYTASEVDSFLGGKQNVLGYTTLSSGV